MYIGWIMFIVFAVVMIAAIIMSILTAFNDEGWSVICGLIAVLAFIPTLIFMIFGLESSGKSKRELYEFQETKAIVEMAYENGIRKWH